MAESARSGGAGTGGGGRKSKSADKRRSGVAKKKLAPKKKAQTQANQRAGSKKRTAKGAAKSTHFEQAKSRAERVLRDPKERDKLVGAAAKAADGKKGSRISAVIDDFRALLRLVKAYTAGDYRAVAWESLVLIVAGMVYFVSPIDAIPDFLPGGLIDDAAVLAFVIGLVAEELADFQQWEARTA